MTRYTANRVRGDLEREMADFTVAEIQDTWDDGFAVVLAGVVRVSVDLPEGYPIASPRIAITSVVQGGDDTDTDDEHIVETLRTRVDAMETWWSPAIRLPTLVIMVESEFLKLLH